MIIKDRTIDFELNRKLKNCLEKYKKIDSPAVGLFPINNIYGRPPYFAFRFNNGVLDDYFKLLTLIHDFSGELIWTMSTKEGSKNWLIEPQIFKELRDRNGFYDKDSLIKLIGDKYYEYCDKALLDIEPLCKFIEEKYLI